MVLMVINEDKKQISNWCGRCKPHWVTHTPKMFVYPFFEENMEYYKIKKQMIEFKTVKGNKITSSLCNVYCVPEWENRTNT